MKPTRKYVFKKQRGVALIVSMIFVIIFSALAVSMAAISGANAQIASNQHKANLALAAAQSGLECARYVVSRVTLPQTANNFVSDDEANTAWVSLCDRFHVDQLDGKAVPITSSPFSDLYGSGDEIIASSLDLGSSGTEFAVRFYRYTVGIYADRRKLLVRSTGTSGEAARQANMEMKITKDCKVLSYAIASRGRMWLTGETTINGDIFSSWDRPEISPYNMTSDSTVLGTINTVLTLDQIKAQTYQMETLDEYDNPIFDEDGDRVYSEEDEVKAQHEGINYGQPYEDMPGMDITDYNTDCYKSGLSTIASCPTAQRVTEYFPHATGNYSKPKDSGSTSYTRHVYHDQTFTNALLPVNRHALFRNCTFEGVLYADCSKTSTSKSYTNNIRFENCTFNGTIITNVPQSLNWKNNCLYFTGEATFDNNSGLDEATILAPHFNVNLGNTNPEASDNNVLTGAIVGGIVDVRGNAQIYGTIISMCDTTAWSSGYVTNIGATLDDGGSETTELGDIGVISITPEQDKMLPSGITSPIIIKPMQETYCEGS